MTGDFVEIDGVRREVKYPYLFKDYLEKNCKTQRVGEVKKSIEQLAAEFVGLAPIAVGIIGTAVITWWVTKEQKAEITKEFLV